jgi:hypothetical protein
MTALEATVEIVKSIMQQGGSGAANSNLMFIEPEKRAEILKGIKEVYETIREVDAAR